MNWRFWVDIIMEQNHKMLALHILNFGIYRVLRTQEVLINLRQDCR